MIGFIRVAAVTPEVQLAHPTANVQSLLEQTQATVAAGISLVVSPELSLTGATCGDLFLTQALQQQTEVALKRLVEQLPAGVLLVCGAPLYVQGRVYDCAAVIQRGRILGWVPRMNVPRHHPGLRCFSPGSLLTSATLPDGTPIGSDLRFTAGALRFGVHVGGLPTHCPGEVHAWCITDATAEGVGQVKRRRDAVRYLSQAHGGAIIYANAGTGESSTDGVYSGHRLVVNEGVVHGETRWHIGFTEMDFAPAWVAAHRLRAGLTEGDAAPTREVTSAVCPTESDGSKAMLRPMPFLPQEPEQLSPRCEEILTLQVQALLRRMRQIHAKRLVLGLSGGLDSTLALVVCAELCRREGLPATTVLAVTMPGFGTGSRTYNNAVMLAQTLGVELRETSIVPCVEQHFKDIGQDPDTHDVTYENAQARARTWILMDLANKEGGLLVGTGDLSEIALGWSTYNGDHMSMYSINCSVPKTLIPPCLTTAAATLSNANGVAADRLLTVLRDICDTPVSPELVPGVQHTEAIVGRYELHDCFLWYFMRYGCDRALLAQLGELLHPEIPEAERERTLDIFCRRVITQQFKRSCSPDGPAVGGIALSPRGGWMLPSDAQLTL